MIKEYSQNRSNVIMNFSRKYCSSSHELLQSRGFRKVLQKYIKKLEKQDAMLLERLTAFLDDDHLDKNLIETFKLLMILEVKEIKKLNKKYYNLLKDKEDIIEFIEGLYNYWRSLERYSLIQNGHAASGIETVNFIEANNAFSNLVLQVYRRIEENILGHEHNVYRQLSAGVNASLVLKENPNNLSEEYKELYDINVIESVILRPPLILYPKRNSRSGFFEEVFENPLKQLNIVTSHYFVYPAKVGDALVFIHFHRDFMNHGVALCNLFEMAEPDEYEHKAPDIVFVFGARLPNHQKQTVFYHDKKEDMYVGYVSNTDEIDYFGYMKKMILTLYNLKTIDMNHLPIHGAMVNITLKNGKNANIAIVGDSGAGKSESLEAFRKLSTKYLKEMKIVFDDMGTFKIENGKVYGYGTEIGAFVRLDDFDSGYAYSVLDRAIIMNPDKINARVLYPVTTYLEIIKGHKVDLLLYANNYLDKKPVMKLIDKKEDAISIFIEGKRATKGTTSETGIVSTFFANPFGPTQREERSRQLIDKYFDTLYKNNTDVGVIHTRLGIPGFEQKGPEKAAKYLFEWLEKK